MRYQGINGWLGGAKKLTTANGEIGAIYLSATPPTDAARADAKAVDFTAGWPSAIVDRADATRAKQNYLWVGDNVVHIGAKHVPLLDLWGGTGDAWQQFVGYACPMLDLCRAWGLGYASASVTTGSLQGYQPSAFLDAEQQQFAKDNLNLYGDNCLDLATSSSAQRAFLEQCMGCALPEDCVFGWYVKMDWEGSAVADAYAAIRVQGFATVMAPWQSVGGAGYVYARVPQKGAWMGVNLLAYVHGTSGQPAYGIPMTLSGFTGNMGQVASKWLMLPLLMIVDPHVVQILAALGVKRGTKSDPRTTDVYADPKVPASRISGPMINATVAPPATIPATIPVPLAPLGGAGGPGAQGFQVYPVFTWGLPEFMTDVTIEGTVTADSNGLHVVDDVRNYVWNGTALAAIEQVNAADGRVTLTDSERAQLASLTVRTASLRQQLSVGADPLSKTSIWRQAQKADYDLLSQQIIEADTVKNLPAVTFAQANKAAGGQSETLWHQMYRVNDIAGDQITAIQITGTMATGIRWSATAGGLVVDADEQDAVIAISSGKPVKNSSDLPTADAVNYLFGITADDMPGIVSSQKEMNSEFEEGFLQKARLWNPRKLVENVQNAYFLMVYARDRKQFHSLVASSLAMAKLARKYAGL
uniref:Spike protein n=1 Tax=Cystovirus phi6 TaxID=10879 RepID=Q1HL69_9VIRU|nr:spike protein [Pseudomonas phage phi6]